MSKEEAQAVVRACRQMMKQSQGSHKGDTFIEVLQKHMHSPSPGGDRFAATLPDTAPLVDDELIVMAFNNENGYDTDGNFNGHCFAKAVRDTAADFVSVPEGDAMVRKVSSLASVLPCYKRLRRRRNGGGAAAL